MPHEHGLFMTKQELRRGVHARFSCESQNALLEIRAFVESLPGQAQVDVMMGSVNEDQHRLDRTCTFVWEVVEEQRQSKNEALEPALGRIWSN
jgi:hypothetical protein